MKFISGTYLRGAFYLGCAVLLCNCMAQERVHVADVNPLGWSKNEPAIVYFPNQDTASMCDLYVVVRYDNRAAGKQIALTIDTESPDSLRFQEPFTLRIPPRNFDRPFERNSCFWECEQPYRQQVQLSRKGVYQFRFTLSETEQLNGISAIGIQALPASSDSKTPKSM